jgi:hypothetical protein
MRLGGLLLLLPLAACGGLALTTTVADRAEVRRAMVDSVRIGQTTDDAFVLRWGQPHQKATEGGRVNFVYRSPQQSANFVIVTFDYGVAVDIRSTETEACRATFAPRVPGYGFDRVEPVYPVGWCGPAIRPGVPLDTVGLGRGSGRGGKYE